MRLDFKSLSVATTTVFFSCCFAQAQLLRTTPPTAAQSEAAIPSFPALGPLIKQTKPVFIFLPGIMGSRLSRKVNGIDEPFWGTSRAFAGNDPAFRYDPDETVSAQVLDDIYLKGIGTTFDVYGFGYNEIKGITGAPEGVLRFPYDWRQSNVRSADDFSKWLCRPDIQSKVKDHSIVFIAHSMGGLVLKYWLKHYYRNPACGDVAQSFASYMPISKIVFLGTPNYGSPKAVLTFSQGESLFYDKPNDESIWRSWSRLLNWVDVNVISGNLNRYGIQYPSAYQLLPIYGKSGPGCLPSTFRSDLDFRTSNNFEANYDLFDPAAWKELGWPVQLEGKKRDDFIDKELPSLLQQAKVFLCDVATYDVDAEFDVVNFYGLHQNTPCNIKFVPPKYSGTIDLPCHGDGTVPDWIATKDWKGKQESNAEPHMRQIAALEFGSYLGRLRRELYSQFASAAAHINEAQAAADFLAEFKYAPVANPTASREDAAGVRKVADLVIAKLNINASDLYEAAKTEPNVAVRANQMLVYTNLTKAEPQQQAWAFNNTAHIYLAKCNFRQSLELARSAIEAADRVSVSQPNLSGDMRNLRAKSAWFAAIAAGQLGKSKEAENYKALAIRNGNKLAASVPVPTPGAGCPSNVKLYPPASARRARV